MSVNRRDAERAPVAVGLNITFTLQDALADNVDGQVLELRKSPALVPVDTMLVIERSAVPLFVSVTACEGLDWPTAVPANVRDDGAMETSVKRPVPLSGTACGLPGASSEKDRFALLEPPWEGEKVTLTAQETDMPRVAGQALVEMTKSEALEPVTMMLDMWRIAVPLFVSTVVSGAEVVPVF